MAGEALSLARSAGDRWNEGYALGTRAAAAGIPGSLREAQQLAKAAIAVMREIDHQWGVARTLLGLGELARLRGDADDAHAATWRPCRSCVKSTPGRRPRAAWPGSGGWPWTRARSRKRASTWPRASGSATRPAPAIGVARGLEAFASLAVLEGRGDWAVQLIAAAAALREAAHLPPLPGAQNRAVLGRGAPSFGEPAIAQLLGDWLGMTSDAAVAMALDVPRQPAAGSGPDRDVTLAAAPGGRAGAARQADARGNARSSRSSPRAAATGRSRTSSTSARPPLPGTWPTSWTSWASARAPRWPPGPRTSSLISWIGAGEPRPERRDPAGREMIGSMGGGLPWSNHG